MTNDNDSPEVSPTGAMESGRKESGQSKPSGNPETEAKGAIEAENARLKDQLMRTLADTENMRRRLQRETDDATRFAVSGFSRELLAVADNLRRALDSLPAELRQQDERIEKFAAGVELTERELMAVFERQGIRRIDALGRPFDHNLHQALFEVETDRPPGTIIQVLQDGYVLHDRLLRPALVGVAKTSAATPPASSRIDTTV